MIIIFGGSGDLTSRKLIPALYNLYLDGWLHEHFLIIGVGRQDMDNTTYRKKLKDGIDKFSRRGKVKKTQWDKFAEKIEFKKADFTNSTPYGALKKQIAAFEKASPVPANKIFYMAVPPQFFETIAIRIGEAGLAADSQERPSSFCGRIRCDLVI